MSIEKNRKLMIEQIQKLKGKVNESKAPRELKKHIGKAVKDFKYDFDGENHYLITFFTDGTKMTVTAWGDMGGVSMDYDN